MEHITEDCFEWGGKSKVTLEMERDIYKMNKSQFFKSMTGLSDAEIDKENFNLFFQKHRKNKEIWKKTISPPKGAVEGDFAHRKEFLTKFLFISEVRVNDFISSQNFEPKVKEENLEM